MFGIRQSGEFSFRMGDIYSDAAVLKEASDAVDRLFQTDPDLELPVHQKLKQHLQEMAAANVDFRSI